MGLRAKAHKAAMKLIHARMFGSPRPFLTMARSRAAVLCVSILRHVGFETAGRNLRLRLLTLFGPMLSGGGRSNSAKFQHAPDCIRRSDRQEFSDGKAARTHLHRLQE